MVQKKKYIERQRASRRKFLLKVCVPYFIITAIVFLFGYDAPMFDKHKLLEFLPPFIALLLIIILVAFLKYRTTNICKNCGAKIKNLNTDCVIGKIEFLGTTEKAEYKYIKKTIKGKTVYPRGGYSLRNSVLEPTSESTYEVTEKIPITKKLYNYNIEYRCRNCNEVYCHKRKLSTEPLHTNN